MSVSDKKRQTIKTTLRATHAKRKHQRCRVFEIKIIARHLSTRAWQHLRRLFLEAKWFYNWVLIQPDGSHVDTKVKQVPIKVGNIFEERSLRCVSSQMKQGFATRVRTSIQSLAAKKSQGQKVGRLKFKRSVRVIPLKQAGITYRFTHGGSRVKLQGLPGSLRVRGSHQIPHGGELANTVLLKKAHGYYLKVVTYTPREDDPIPPTRSIGLDVGLKRQFTISNGVVVEYRVPVSHSTKLWRLYREFSRKQPGSMNQYKALLWL